MERGLDFPESESCARPLLRFEHAFQQRTLRNIPSQKQHLSTSKKKKEKKRKRKQLEPEQKAKGMSMIAFATSHDNTHEFATDVRGDCWSKRFLNEPVCERRMWSNITCRGGAHCSSTVGWRLCSAAHSEVIERQLLIQHKNGCHSEPEQHNSRVQVSHGANQHTNEHDR